MNLFPFPFARSFPDSGIFGVKSLILRRSPWFCILTVMCGLVGWVSADQSGDFTYTDNGTSITITDYPAAAAGAVVIPDTIGGKPVTTIGTSAFQACTGITSVTIAASVTSIGSFAFEGCTALTSVIIPIGVVSIESYTFKGCTAMTTVELPSGLSRIEIGVFSGCTGLTSVIIPSSVTDIKDYAFTGCKALTGVSLPSGILTIGFGAFSNCGGLTSVTVPAGVTVIAGGVFSSCSSMTSVVFQGAVTTIGANAFLYCGQLASFAIPGTVTSIGRGAFQECKALTTINIPANVSIIGTTSAPSVFVNCSALGEITVDAANTTFSSVGGVLMNHPQSILITCPGGRSGAYLIPATVTEVSIQAFANCEKLTGITMPSGLAKIRSKAFSNCSMLSAANFTADAPTTMSGDAFSPTSNNFAIYYPSTANGFTSPTWYGYPAFGITGDPVVAWLTSHQLPADSDLKSDLDGDGVSLLMAYALNLDPNQNLSGALPQPVFTTGQMSLSYYSGAAGVAYVVATSTDLQHWTTSGVSVSGMDANQMRTATVGNAELSKFMRISVSR
ncbi:MAG: leucine-rich repeat domain-containing protein [Luteolibacter sp.]